MIRGKDEINIKQDKPIYCWRLNKDTNKIKKYVITEYTYDKFLNNKSRYIFYYAFGNGTPTKQYVRESNFDKYVYHSYYSFDGNDKIAIDTILADYRWNASNLAAKLDKINETINAIIKENNYEKK